MNSKRSIIITLLGFLISFSSCIPSHIHVKDGNFGQDASFEIIQIAANMAYVIDRVTETCAMWVGNASWTVPCDKLARNLPAARGAITWIQTEPQTSEKTGPQAEKPNE